MWPASLTFDLRPLRPSTPSFDWDVGEAQIAVEEAVVRAHGGDDLGGPAAARVVWLGDLLLQDQHREAPRLEVGDELMVVPAPAAGERPHRGDILVARGFARAQEDGVVVGEDLAR